jgi:predicted RNA-binding protein with PUA-like domain
MKIRYQPSSANGTQDKLGYTAGWHKSLSAAGRPALQRRMESVMADYYLLKTEPSEYSFADLTRDKETEWDGVKNPVAIRHLGEMDQGARLIIYETGGTKSAVGMATVLSVNAQDPKKPVVKIKVGKALAKPITLATIKANKLFADSPLVRIGRLSVVPLTATQYKALGGA